MCMWHRFKYTVYNQFHVVARITLEQKHKQIIHFLKYFHIYNNQDVLSKSEVANSTAQTRDKHDRSEVWGQLRL